MRARKRKGSIVFNKTRGTWNFLWVEAGNRKSRKLGTLTELPTRADALRKAEAVRRDLKLVANRTVITVNQLVPHYRAEKFESGSTWGDSEAGKQIFAARPQRLAFLKHLVEVYYERGEAAFTAALDEPTLGRHESSAAGCLKADADYEKIATIELVKKRLADALE